MSFYQAANELSKRQGSFEKSASILGLLGMLGATHVAPNLLMKAIKSTNVGHRALTGSFGAGVEMGRKGEDLQYNWKNALQYGVGPESLVDMQLGQKLGQRLKEKFEGKTPEEQERFMNRFRGMVRLKYNSLNPEQQQAIHETPLVNSFHNWIEGHENKNVRDFLLKRTQPAGQEPTLLNRVGDAAMVGGLGAADMHLLAQPAISAVRKTVAQSKLGKKVLENGYDQGKAGVEIPKWKQTLTDFAVSPAVLDPYRIGRSMRQNLPPDISDAIEKHVKPMVFNKPPQQP